MAKHTFTEAGAKRIVAAVRKVEGGEPPGRRGGPAFPGYGGIVWCQIISSASAGTGKWTYTVKVMIGGDATSHSGLKLFSATTYSAYNVAEELSNTGYVNSSVTGILAIPNSSIIPCTWSNRNGATVLIFRERNEPTCT